MIPDSRAYRLAWGMALLFLVLEYATRSKSAVLIPGLEQTFARTSLGISTILGSHYTYADGGDHPLIDVQ